MEKQMMICAAAGDCTSKNFSHCTPHHHKSGCSDPCVVGSVGHDDRCVPVPEAVECDKGDTCCEPCSGREPHALGDSCTGGCRHGGKCVPVAAKPKPDPRLAMDAAWDRLAAALAAVDIARGFFQEKREDWVGDRS